MKQRAQDEHIATETKTYFVCHPILTHSAPPQLPRPRRFTACAYSKALQVFIAFKLLFAHYGEVTEVRKLLPYSAVVSSSLTGILN